MSDSDEDINSYETISLKVVGLDIAEGATAASLLVKDSAGKKMALQLDLEALLRAFEHVAHAMHQVAFNVTGSYVHVPLKSFEVAPIEKSVAASVSFGTIGLFCMKLSEIQASELGRRLLESTANTSVSTGQIVH